MHSKYVVFIIYVPSTYVRVRISYVYMFVTSNINLTDGHILGVFKKDSYTNNTNTYTASSNSCFELNFHRPKSLTHTHTHILVHTN